jgi:P-type Cu2+ transporter
LVVEAVSISRVGATVGETCLHCGLPIPLERRERGDSFCCDGCARVRELILSSGLDRFYELRGPASAPPADMRGANFAWLDPVPAGAGPRSMRADVQGVHCAACIWLLGKLFRRHPGAIEIRINPTIGSADISWDPGQLDIRRYFTEVEQFGYRFGPRRKEGVSHSRGLLIRIGVSAAMALNVMLFSIAFYAGLGPADASIHDLFGRLSLAMTSVSVTVGGWVFIRSAASALRRRIIHMDLPIALGIILAFGGSIQAYASRGPEGSYFDTVAAFITLMLLGRWLQERVLERNGNSILADSGPDHLITRRLRRTGLESVPVGALRRGDQVWIVPGDIVPVRGILLSDHGRVSLDWITGESDVHERSRGEEVEAGGFNSGGTVLMIAAQEDFADSRLNQLLSSPALGLAARDQVPAWSWWSRIARIYVAGVLALAGLGFAVWIPRGIAPALKVTVSILVVTCPCAIGIGIPLVQELTHTSLRRRGIFVRKSGFLDRSLKIRRIAFDKTGTLTQGRRILESAGLAAIARLPDRDRSALERMVIRSNHPVSRSLAEALRRNAASTEIESGNEVIEEIPGLGIEARGPESVYRLGRPGFATGDTRGSEDSATTSSATLFSRDKTVIAEFRFMEELKPDIAAEIDRLERAGYEVRILSGDTPARTSAVAQRIGIPPALCEGGLSPEEKARRIRDLGPGTLMVGDGLNDALSFQAAECTATPAIDRPALPAIADFYFLGDGIAAVRKSLAAGRHQHRVIRSSLLFAAVYNALALALAFGGLLQPVVAAVLMPLSSLTVVLHAVYRMSGRSLAWTS